MDRDRVAELYDGADPGEHESYDGTREFAALARRAIASRPRSILCVGANVAEVRFFEAYGSVTALDVSEAVLDRIAASTSARTIRGSVVGFDPADRYDLIWACRSLIHLEPEQLASIVTRLRGLLARNGRLALVLIVGDENRYEPGPLRYVYTRSYLESAFDTDWSFVDDDDGEPCACALFEP